MSAENHTILLVEDDATTRLLIQYAIDDANLDVSIQVLADGVRAICYLAGRDPYTDRQCYPLPTLILTDVNLPYVSGLELLAWVKQQIELTHIPIVLMSNSDDRFQMTQAQKLGASAYFVKMSSLDNLIQILETFIEN